MPSENYLIWSSGTVFTIFAMDMGAPEMGWK